MNYTLIYGSGAIATWLLAKYLPKDQSFYMVSRSARISRSLRTFSGEVKSFQGIPISPKKILPQQIYICAKAYDVPQILQEIKAQGWAHVPIVIACNGAVYERNKYLLSQFSSIKFATLFVGVSPAGIESQMFQENSLYNDVLIGAWQNEEWRQSFYKKFFTNVVVNTYSGVFRIPYNGFLLQRLEELLPLAQETYQMMQILWLEELKSLRSFEHYWLGMVDVLNKTYSNENSMACDVRMKRRTEVEYLSGLSWGLAMNLPRLKNFSQILRIEDRGCSSSPPPVWHYFVISHDL